MLYMLASFTPWITYWVLCCVGSGLGVALPLLISLILVVHQTRKGSPNLMDLVSLIYFSIASAATFIFDSGMFIEKSGFLGYSALSMMTAASLAIGQPYTLQVSKRKYPEIYWRDKLFLTVNNVITVFWAAIFVVNALIFLVFEFPLSLIIANTLIAVGIVFSAVFPLHESACVLRFKGFQEVRLEH